MQQERASLEITFDPQVTPSSYGELLRRGGIVTDKADENPTGASREAAKSFTKSVPPERATNPRPLF
jgi:hypothetical protein